MMWRRTSNVSNSPSLLRVMYERPVDTLSTETPSEMVIDQDMIASQCRDFKCYFCGKRCKSSAGRSVHERIHRKQKITQKRKETLLKHQNDHRIYNCEECCESFTKRIYLTKHMKTQHPIEIKCNFCNKSFKDKMEFEWHDAINDGLNHERLKTPLHRTRSQSRLSCHRFNASENKKRANSCGPALVSHACLSYTSTERINGRHKTRRKRSDSTYSSRSDPAKKSRSNWFDNDSCNYSDEDDLTWNDSVSVRGSRSPFRGMSDDLESLPELQGSLRSIKNGGISPASSKWSNCSSPTYCGYDKFFCNTTGCGKTFRSLHWLTTHEMVEHKKLALFPCRVCRKRFTSNENLLQHKVECHPTCIVCVLCGNPQRNLEIQEHAQLHLKFSIKCDLCEKQFLSKYYLDEHLKTTIHHKHVITTKIHILTRIDRRETMNKVQENIDLSAPDFSYSELCLRYSQDKVRLNGLVDDLPWRS